MVISCAAYGCKNVQKSGDSSVSFHRFPLKRPDVLKQWVKAMWRDQWQPSKFSRLCSDHFTEDDYQVRPGAEYKLLKDHAVPTLFHIPKHVVEKIPKHTKLLVTTPASVKQSSALTIDQINNRKENKKICANAQNKLRKIRSEDQSVTQPFKSPNVDVQTQKVKKISNGGCTEKKTYDSFTVNSLKRKVRMLQTKLREREKRIKTLEYFISTHKKKCVCTSVTISKTE